MNHLDHEVVSTKSMKYEEKSGDTIVFELNNYLIFKMSEYRSIIVASRLQKVH